MYLIPKIIEEKRGAIILLIAFFIGSLSSTDYLISLGVLNYTFSPYFTVISVLMIAYGIYKYQLIVTPEIAAKTITSTMTDALIVVDSNLKILFINERFLKLFKYNSEQELLEQSFIRIFSKSRAVISNAQRGILAKEQKYNFKNKQGEEVPVSINISLVKKNKKMIGFLFVIKDMTEINYMIEELRKKNLILNKTQKALKSQVEKLEKFNRLAVGRENKMVELKEKIKELESRG